MNQQSARATAISYLKSLSDKEFVDLFYEAAEDRNVCNDLGAEFEGDFDSTTWIIATSDYGRINGKEDPEPYTLIAAIPSPEWSKTELVHESRELLNSGACERCSIELQCVAKEAVCPICNSIVSCT